jgi:tetratricopeptide (TPR) repeat protein
MKPPLVKSQSKFCGTANKAIELQPDYVDPYYNRGDTYVKKGEKEKAIADFNKFLELSNDPYWRQRAEEQLKVLGAK